ncbi:Alpha/Beta hydrolase protein [Xylariales sp. AK1849]|nr:Alpha/Beta hydrolase protein [Xylariales sp. AK1849]
MTSSDEFYLGNPALIYEGVGYLSAQQVPLILVHDGGGTTFSYHCLDPTNRPLYGIQNAHLDDGGWWDGGIPEMARHYIGLISKVLPAGGDIILGGWSLGGILSLEMAHQMATDTTIAPKYRVLGIVLIDSICPKRVSDIPGMANVLPTQRVMKSEEELKAMKLKEKVNLNMIHARMMIQRWDLPRWNKARPPPAILLRAKEFVNPTSTSFVDHSRQDRLLGWETYSREHGDFIREIVDVEGHHFSLFEEGNITNITTKICAAANSLEQDK